MAKSAILALRIIGDATGAQKALNDTSTALDKWAPGAALAGGAAAAALTAGFADAVSVEAGLSKLEGQLGLTEAEAERVGIVSAELFANGWGTGADQINEALHSVIGNIDGMRTASDEQLSGVSQAVLTLANTFDQDLGGVTTAVGQMMRTGMAEDANEALDIITKGLQSNARAGDDLLDTFTEYPALFERLGIDGQTATGLIAQGLDAGARSTDLVADALKEFQIRATDGSTASAEAFRLLGMDAEAMTAQIAAGGDGAAAGLDAVLDGLRNMTDPVAQNAAAVGLFGTQAEDLGGALYALDPSTATAALGEVGGAAEKLGATVSDNAGATITEFARSVQTSFQEVAAQAIPVLQPVIEMLREFAPILGPLAVVIAAVSAGILVANGVMKAWAAVQAIQTAAQWANNAAWLASPITWIILAIIAAIALLVVGIVWVVQHWDELKLAAAAVWQSIIDWVQQAVEWVQVRVVAAVAVATAIWENIKTAAAAVWQAVIQWVDRAIAPIRDGIANAIQTAVNWFFSMRDQAVGALDSIIAWVRDLLSWLGDLARNAIPGWAKDLLGMSSFAMPITPEVASLTPSDYQARMLVTPQVESFAAPVYEVATPAPIAQANLGAMVALTSLVLPALAPAPREPAQTVYEDHSENHFHFPNYMGDKDEIVDEIEEALEKRKRRRGGVIEL